MNSDTFEPSIKDYKGSRAYARVREMNTSVGRWFVLGTKGWQRLRVVDCGGTMWSEMPEWTADGDKGRVHGRTLG